MTAKDMETKPLQDIITWLETKPKRWQSIATCLAPRLKHLRAKAKVSKEELNRRAGLYSPGCTHLESFNHWHIGLSHAIRALRVYQGLDGD